jgi:cytochrome c-type biogenesis protein CcmH
MRRALALLVLLLALVPPAASVFADAPGKGEDPALAKRVMTLSAELRCLVCQNQSLADSNADLAVDLRNQVRDLMLEGRTDAEIKAYLTERYGDFVLYRPPVKSTTWLLWVGPFVLLAVAVAALVLYLRRRAQAVDAAPSELTPEERARAQALLAEDAARRP